MEPMRALVLVDNKPSWEENVINPNPEWYNAIPNGTRVDFYCNSSQKVLNGLLLQVAKKSSFSNNTHMENVATDSNKDKCSCERLEATVSEMKDKLNQFSQNLSHRVDLLEVDAAHTVRVSQKKIQFVYGDSPLETGQIEYSTLINAITNSHVGKRCNIILKEAFPSVATRFYVEKIKFDKLTESERKKIEAVPKFLAMIECSGGVQEYISQQENSQPEYNMALLDKEYKSIKKSMLRSRSNKDYYAFKRVLVALKSKAVEICGLTGASEESQDSIFSRIQEIIGEDVIKYNYFNFPESEEPSLKLVLNDECHIDTIKEAFHKKDIEGFGNTFVRKISTIQEMYCFKPMVINQSGLVIEESFSDDDLEDNLSVEIPSTSKQNNNDQVAVTNRPKRKLDPDETHEDILKRSKLTVT